MSYSDVIAVPPRDAINTGLHAVTEAVMLAKFGRPGALTRDCSDPSDDFRPKLVFGVQVAPHLRVSGLRDAVRSLQEIFDEVRREKLELYEQVKGEGMLCIRHRRTTPSRYSNHSWGAAIDLYFGDDSVVNQGDPRCHRGNLALYPFFHRHSWYWGAEFPGDSVDSMHFELSREAIEAM